LNLVGTRAPAIAPAPRAEKPAPPLNPADRLVHVHAGICEIVTEEPDGSRVTKSLQAGEQALVSGGQLFALRRALSTVVEILGGECEVVIRDGLSWQHAVAQKRPKPQIPMQSYMAWSGELSGKEKRLVAARAQRDELNVLIAQLELDIGELRTKLGKIA
jgi:hypothetical protein